MDAETRLLHLIHRLDQDRIWSLQELGSIVEELEALGKEEFPDRGSQEDSSNPWEQLGQHLVKFQESQQQRIVSALAPLRQDVCRRMSDFADVLNRWLSSACQEEKPQAWPQQLIAHFQAIDRTPQLRCYRHCGDLDVKTRFMVAVAGAVRAAQDPALLRPHLAAHPQAAVLAQRLSSSFFTLPSHGNVLAPWHDARLDGYDALWRSVADRATELFREELQRRLASALVQHRRKEPSQERSGPSLQLSAWPMAACPIAQEFRAFATEKAGKLDGSGPPVVTQLPAHTLRPAVLQRLLEALDAFSVDASQGSAVLVKLTPPWLAKFPPAQVAKTAPEAAPTPAAPAPAAPAPAAPAPAAPAPAAPAPVAPSGPSAGSQPSAALEPSPAAAAQSASGSVAAEGPSASSADAEEAESITISKGSSAWSSTPSVSVTASAGSSAGPSPANQKTETRGVRVMSFGGGLGGPSAPAASSAGSGGASKPQFLGFEMASSRGKPKAGGLRIAKEAVKAVASDAPKIVRRPIDWKDTKFLERLVRKGLKAEDQGWKDAWEELCARKEISPSFAGQKPPREVLVEFVEVNLVRTKDKDWAKHLYKRDGEEDPVQIEDSSSDEEAEEVTATATAEGTAAPAQTTEAGDASSSSSSEDGDDDGIAMVTQVSKPAKTAETKAPEVAKSSKVEEAANVAEAAKTIASPDETAKAAEAQPQLPQQQVSEAKEKSKKEKKDKKGKKDKDKKDKKEKKEKKEKKKQKEAEKQAAANESNDSSDDLDLSAPPGKDHKVKMCFAFLEGRCHKGRLCTCAHAESELKKQGEAFAEFQKRARAKQQQLGPANPPGAPPTRPPPMGRMPPRWPPHDARPMGMPPGHPHRMMGMPHMMDPMMMGPPGMMTVPMMGHMPPEMMHGLPGPFPHMAMMMDPSAMVGGDKRRKEKHDKSKRSRSREKEKEKDKSKKKDKKEKEIGREKPKDIEDDAGKAKKAKRKGREKEEAASRKERKVDDEDL